MSATATIPAQSPAANAPIDLGRPRPMTHSGAPYSSQPQPPNVCRYCNAEYSEDIHHQHPHQEYAQPQDYNAWNAYDSQRTNQLPGPAPEIGTPYTASCNGSVRSFPTARSAAGYGAHRSRMFDDRKLFVGNLPPQVTVADLYKHFQAFGTVELVSMLKQKSISGCKCAFVVMATVQEALQCMDKSMNDPEYKAIAGWPQFPIAVRWANQHRSSDEEALCYAETGANANHNINASVAFGQDRTNVFATPTGKEAAHVDGEIKLFVGNLPPNVSQLAVTEVFHVFGGLLEVFVFRRPSMRDQNSRCAFVRFDNDQSAYQAMAHLDGKIALGRQLIVRLANARSPGQQE